MLVEDEECGDRGDLESGRPFGCELERTIAPVEDDDDDDEEEEEEEAKGT